MCNAKAMVGRFDVEGQDKYVLMDASTNHTHPGSMAHAVAEDMKLSMCKLVE